MTELGVFAVDRGVFGHPLFKTSEPFSRREAWLWLVSEAAWKPRRVGTPGGIVQLERGQLCHSQRFMATAWGWDKAKVERFLGRLKTEAMIEAATEAGQTVITICKYNDYQRVSLPDQGREQGSDRGGSEAAPRQTKDIQTFNNSPKAPKGTKARKGAVEGYGNPSHPLFADFRSRIWSKRWERPNNAPLPAYRAYAKLSEADREACAAAIARCAGIITADASEPRYRPMLSSWIGRRGWEGEASPEPAAVDWSGRMAYFREQQDWPIGWGPRPGEPGCRVPRALLVAVA